MVFQPSFAETQAAVLSVLDGVVQAVMGIPRISPATINSNSLAAPPPASSVGALAHSSTVVPVADPGEDLIQDAIVVRNSLQDSRQPAAGMAAWPASLLAQAQLMSFGRSWRLIS